MVLLRQWTDVEKVIMGAGERGLSRYLVELCGRHPKIALIFLPLAGWMIYSGVSDAKFAQGTLDRSPVAMKVERAYKASGTLGATRHRAEGRVPASKEPVVVRITRKQFGQLKAGDTLEIVATGVADKPFVTRTFSQTQLGKVRFSIGPVPFNDVAIFGCIGCMLAIGWVFFGRQLVDRFSTSNPSANQEQPPNETA